MLGAAIFITIARAANMWTTDKTVYDVWVEAGSSGKTRGPELDSKVMFEAYPGQKNCAINSKAPNPVSKLVRFALFRSFPGILLMNVVVYGI